MRAIRWVLPGLLVCAAFGQNAAPRLEFEVASIKPAEDITVTATSGQVNVGVHIDGAQVRYRYLSLMDYIRMAYKVKNYQVVGPDWINSTRFDISAKLPAGATQDQAAAMLQSLLADRFGLSFHRDKKDFPVYALVVGKTGAKMKESPLEPNADGTDPAKSPVNVQATGSAAGTTVNYGHGAYMTFADNKFEVRKMAMPAVADTLSRFMEKPVVDMTDLKSTYDFDLNMTAEDYRVMLIRSAVAAGVQLPPEALRLLEGQAGDSLPAALDLVGLKLESRKAPLDVLIVDKVLKAPIEN